MWEGISEIRVRKCLHSCAATMQKVHFRLWQPRALRLRAEPRTVNKADSTLVQAHPSIPASLHPTLPEQLRSRPSQDCVIRRKPSNRPRRSRQILARAVQRRFTTYLCTCVNRIKLPIWFFGSFSQLVEALQSKLSPCYRSTMVTFLMKGIQ